MSFLAFYLDALSTPGFVWDFCWGLSDFELTWPFFGSRDSRLVFLIWIQIRDLWSVPGGHNGHRWPRWPPGFEPFKIAFYRLFTRWQLVIWSESRSEISGRYNRGRRDLSRSKTVYFAYSLWLEPRSLLCLTAYCFSMCWMRQRWSTIRFRFLEFIIIKICG